MNKANKKKTDQLGMTLGRARNILLRELLFEFVCDNNQDICFRCGKHIETVDELSVDHKEPWLDSDNPIKKFFDTTNVAFSHNSCNSRAGKKVTIFLPGLKNPSSKLTPQAVIDIRNSSLSLAKLGRKYNVCSSTIHDANPFLTVHCTILRSVLHNLILHISPL